MLAPPRTPLLFVLACTGPLQSVRQEIRASAGKLSPLGSPLVSLATDAMMYFGVPSFGVHVNGFVPADGELGFDGVVLSSISHLRTMVSASKVIYSWSGGSGAISIISTGRNTLCGTRRLRCW